MTQIAWSFADRGAQYRPPVLRVYLAPVVTTSGADGSAAADWRGEEPAAHWQPRQLTWGVNGQPSVLRLDRVLGAGPGKPDRDRPEDVLCQPGDRIRLVEVHGGGPLGSTELEWFRGYVAQERMLIQAGPAAESLQLTVYGPETVLRGKVASGQWHARPEVDQKLISGTASSDDLVAEGMFRSHLPVIFNEDGRPNASPAQAAGQDAAWRLDPGGGGPVRGGRTFEAPGRRIATPQAAYAAEMWRARPAIQSLVEVVDGYQVISPKSLAGFPEDLWDRAIGEVDVEGMDLLGALRAVLLPIGYGFCLEPWAGADGRHILHVFGLQGSTDGRRVRRPRMAPILGAPVAITDYEGQRAEVQRIEFIRDNHGVANDVTVIGGQKRKQIVLTFASEGGQLKPAWDTQAHDLADWATDDIVDPMQWPADAQGLRTVEYFDEHYAYGARGKADGQHVFRSFAWNEDGAFIAVVGDIPDLSQWGVEGEAAYVRRPRPAGPTLLLDHPQAKARTFPAFVQLGIEGDDDSWIQVPAIIWPDRAGFTIPVDPLWDWHPYATEYARHATSGGQTLFDAYGQYCYLTLLHNALRGSGTALTLRLVGSVECDQAVAGHAPRGRQSSWPLVARRVIRAENRFIAREVPDGSDPLGLTADRHDTRDDAAAADDLAQRTRDACQDEVGHGSVLLRHITRTYAPGDVIPATTGRVVDLTVGKGQGARAPVVVGVVWTFQPDGSKTELILDTPLLRVSP